MTFRPDCLVLHHSAGGGTLEALAAKRFYHLCIEDAELDAGPRLLVSVPGDRASTYATGGYNSRAVAICVLGNFEFRQPSPLLLPYLVQVFAARLKHYQIHPDRIFTHGYVGKVLVAPNNRYVTACCGKNLAPLVPLLRQAVRRYL